jgi:hypothetical protein
MIRLCDGLKGEVFFKKGSDLQTNRYEHLVATLKKNREMVHHYADVEHEHRSYHTRTSRYRDIQEYIINSKKLIFKIPKASKKEEIAKKLKYVNEEIDFKNVNNKTSQP